MKLAGKLAGKTAAVLAGLALVAGSGLWGLRSLSVHFEQAADAYEELRAVYQIGYHAATVRLLLRQGGADRQAMRQELHAAEALATSFGADDQLRAALRQAQQHMAEGDQGDGGALNAALGEVAERSRQIRERIVDRRRAAADQLWLTSVLIGALSGAVMLAAVAIGVSQYRGVIGPLRRLEQGVRGVAAADFSRRIEPAGDAEFIALAGQFNAMAERLERMYQTLREQVEAKSRQLARSEALASVGTLAAGLAHEINNPLAIIGGYAESALKRIERQGAPPPGADQRVAQALAVIADEAFRCKQITARLLTLARPADAPRAPVELAGVLRRTAELVGNLPQLADRTIRVDAPEGLRVVAHEGELTQVAVNLLVNALEATAPGGGQVAVHAERRDGWAVVRVSDNGRGMDPQTLRRVFEPFFTDKPRRDQRGTGLGLSVSHAIVAQHGGRLAAHSPGPGLGSVFTLELPCA